MAFSGENGYYEKIRVKQIHDVYTHQGILPVLQPSPNSLDQEVQGHFYLPTISKTESRECLHSDLFQIGSPIDLNLIAKVVESTDGVESILTPKNSIVVSKNSEDAFFDSDALTTRSYNDNVFNPQILYKDGFIYPPRGGLFEMRYTLRDIVIAAN